MLGLGLGITGVRGLWSPARLFSGGAQGLFLDPSDLTTMFQDRAGTTLVTTPGQSVGLVLDKSRGLTPGPELVTNGDFSDGTTGWTLGAGWSVTSGVAVRDGTVGASNLSGGAGVEIGKTYRVTWTQTGSSFVAVYLGSTSGPLISNTNVSGTYSVLAVATVTGGVVFRASAAVSAIDNISVREIPGNHMVATADASRGTYGIEPFGGRRNLLTWTEQFDNAAWVVEPSGVATITKSTTNAAAAHDGTMTADRVIFNLNGGTTTGDIALLRQGATVPAGSATHSVYLRSFDGVSSYVMQIIGADGLGVNITVTPIWQRFSVTATSPGTATNYGIRLRGGQSPANSDTADILIWGAQLELGSTATPYQRVTTAFDVTEAGVPTVHYVQFDGADDGYLTSTITPGTDKVQVFAGVRKLSDVAGHIAGGNGNISGHWEILSSGWASASSRYGAGFYTNVLAQIDSPPNFTPPRTDVLSWRFDTSGATGPDKAKLNVNGVAQTLTIAGLPTGANFGAFVHYIGRRGGTTLPFNGRLYQMVVRFGPNLTADQIAATEAWVNSKTGAY